MSAGPRAGVAVGVIHPGSELCWKEGVMIMKEERDSRYTRSILISFAVGGLVGAGAALLLAPKSGKELRKDIKGLAVDTRNKVNETIDRGKELYVDNVTAIKGAVEAGKTAYLTEMEKHRKAA